jgi:AcrR family transcriptional regulator
MSNMSVSSLGAAQISRKEARRGELLDAADRAIRREGPTVSMDEIAAEAGVTKPILYRHFGDKAGLSQALGQRYLELLLGALREALDRETEPAGRLSATIDAYLALVEREPELYRFVIQETIAELATTIAERRQGGAAASSFLRGVAAEVTRLLREEAARFGVEVEFAEEWAHGIVGMVHLAGDRWLERRNMPRAKLVESLTTLLLGGLTSLAVPQPDARN